MALPNARSQYLKTQVETASKEQLVVMLFDGIIRFTENARKAMQEEKLEESHNALMRAQAIVMELICTLDREKGGEVAGNLMSLHAYAFNCLIVCNMKKDISKIDEVQHIYRELREGWVGAMDRLGIASSAAAASGSPDKAVTGTATSAPVAVTSSTSTSAPAKPASPARPSIGGGIMAAAAAPAPAAVAPAPAAAGYGMGRTAGLGLKPAAPVAAAARPAAPAVAASAKPAAPAAKPAAPAVAKPATPAAAAMLSAYGKARSIA